jgi:hypothetical protein
MGAGGRKEGETPRQQNRMVRVAQAALRRPPRTLWFTSDLFWRVGSRTLWSAKHCVRSVVGRTPGNRFAELKVSAITLSSPQMHSLDGKRVAEDPREHIGRLAGNDVGHTKAGARQLPGSCFSHSLGNIHEREAQ